MSDNQTDDDFTVDMRDLYAPDGGNDPDDEYPFLTEYQAQRLMNFITEAELAYAEHPVESWGDDPNVDNDKTNRAEKRIYAFIGKLLAEKDAEIATLKGRQIPPDMPFAPELDYLASCNQAVQDAWTQAIEHIGKPELPLALQLVEAAYSNRAINHYELMRAIAYAKKGSTK